MLKKLSRVSPIVFILGLALVLRLFGLTHGFPVIRHPDEPTVIQTALALRFDPNPGHFDWPHLFIYLSYVVFMGFAKLRDLLAGVGFKQVLLPLLPLMWNDNLIFYYLSRLLSAIFGVLTIIPLYKAGSLLFNKRVGLYAGLVLAVLPFHVRYSHYALPDIPMVFFMSVGLYFAAKALKTHLTSTYAFSGLFFGLAASTKYHGLLGFLSLGLSFLFSPKNIKTNLLKAVLAGIVLICGFVIGTPFAVLDFSTFSSVHNYKGAFWQFRNVGSVELPEHFAQVVDSFFVGLPDDFGYTFYIGAIVSIGMGIMSLLRKKVTLETKCILWLSIPAAVLFYYISGFIKTPSHYYFIIYPYMVLLAAYFINYLSAIFKQKVFRLLVLIVYFVLPLLLSISQITVLINR